MNCAFGAVHLRTSSRGYAARESVLIVDFASAAIDPDHSANCGLQAARLVRGVVRDRDGKPVPNARVLLQGRNADCDRLAVQGGNWSRVDQYLGERLVRCDTNGNFAFGDVAVGKYLLGFDVLPKPVVAVGAVEVEVAEGESPALQQLVR